MSTPPVGLAGELMTIILVLRVDHRGEFLGVEPEVAFFAQRGSAPRVPPMYSIIDS